MSQLAANVIPVVVPDQDMHWAFMGTPTKAKAATGGSGTSPTA